MGETVLFFKVCKVIGVFSFWLCCEMLNTLTFFGSGTFLVLEFSF